MNKLKTLLPLCYLAIAEIGVGASLDDVFISLYNEMNTTNTTQSAFMSAVTGDRFCWFNHYRAARGNIPTGTQTWLPLSCQTTWRGPGPIAGLE